MTVEQFELADGRSVVRFTGELVVGYEPDQRPHDNNLVPDPHKQYALYRGEHGRFAVHVQTSDSGAVHVFADLEDALLAMPVHMHDRIRAAVGPVVKEFDL